MTDIDQRIEAQINKKPDYYAALYAVGEALV